MDFNRKQKAVIAIAVTILILALIMFYMPLKIESVEVRGDFTPDLYGTLRNRGRLTVNVADVTFEVTGEPLREEASGDLSERLKNRSISKIKPGEKVDFYIDLIFKFQAPGDSLYITLKIQYKGITSDSERIDVDDYYG